MSDKGKRKMDSDDEETRKQIPSSSPSVPPGLNPQDLSETRESSQKTTEGCLEGYAGDLESDAEKEGKRIKYSDNDYDSRLVDKQITNPLSSEYADSNKKNEDLDIICEIEILDTNRLVIPLQKVSGHFPDLTQVDLILDQTLQLTDLHHDDWKMSLSYDDLAHTYAITQGLDLYLKHYHLNASDIIRIYTPLQQLHTHHFDIRHEKRLGWSLFVVEVTKSNSLVIPYDLEVVKYLNPSQAPLPSDHLPEYPLHLIDHLNRKWEMKYICFEDEVAYVVFRGWEEYAACYGLNHKDTVRFFEHEEENNFIIFHEPGPEPIIRGTFLSRPTCLQMNFLCELEMTKDDVVGRKLAKGEEDWWRLAMPSVRLPFKCKVSQQVMAKLTDMNNKNWYVLITKSGNWYLIEDGWEGYVREHGLEAGYVVKFYLPGDADHDKHFLIQNIMEK